jgi:hypothetical protein
MAYLLLKEIKKQDNRTLCSFDAIYCWKFLLKKITITLQNNKILWGGGGVSRLSVTPSNIGTFSECSHDIFVTNSFKIEV